MADIKGNKNAKGDMGDEGGEFAGVRGCATGGKGGGWQGGIGKGEHVGNNGSNGKGKPSRCEFGIVGYCHNVGWQLGSIRGWGDDWYEDLANWKNSFPGRGKRRCPTFPVPDYWTIECCLSAFACTSRRAHYESLVAMMRITPSLFTHGKLNKQLALRSAFKSGELPHVIVDDTFARIAEFITKDHPPPVKCTNCDTFLFGENAEAVFCRCLFPERPIWSILPPGRYETGHCCECCSGPSSPGELESWDSEDSSQSLPWNE